MRAGNASDWPKRIHFGNGSLDEIRQIMDKVGGHRAMVVCGATVSSGPMLRMVKDALGDRFAGVFTEVRSHTPIGDVMRATQQMKELGCDTVVSVGGGSAIDAGKGIVLLSASGGDFAPYAIEYAVKGMARQAMGESAVIHIAVPTTAGSASDVMPTAGIRDPEKKTKMLFWDDRLVPDATILDPRMAIYASPELTAATGMTAVARAIESLYSKERNPIATGLALQAARMMRKSLPRSVSHPDDLQARADCQMACAMAGMAAINSMVSLVHAIGHVVGGRYSLQHGISHAILLAPALRRMLPSIGADSSLVLDALGCPHTDDPQQAAASSADAIEALVKQLPLPQRLRDVGVQEHEISGIAAATMNDYMMANLPCDVSMADVESLLREAW